jgi:hypothetical protein
MAGGGAGELAHQLADVAAELDDQRAPGDERDAPTRQVMSEVGGARAR